MNSTVKYGDADRHGWRRAANLGMPYNMTQGQTAPFTAVDAISHDVDASWLIGQSGYNALFVSDRGTVWLPLGACRTQPTALTTMIECECIQPAPKSPVHQKGQTGIFGLDYIKTYWRKRA